MDELDKIQSALSKMLDSRNGEASIFFMGSAAKVNARGSLFIPGLSDVDLLVVPHCDSLEAYTEWLKIVAELHKELNQASNQLFDVFILSDHIASLHFACLSTLAGPLLGDEALVTKKYSTIKLVQVYINPEVRVYMYRAMLRRMIHKAQYLLPVADTSRGRKTVKYLRKLIKAAICSHANPEEIDALEKDLLGINDLSSLKRLLDKKLHDPMPLDDIFQSVLDGKRVSDWPGWMTAQEELTYWLAQLEKSMPPQDPREMRLYDGVVRIILMLIINLKAVLGESEERRQKKISKFADDTASALVQLALSGIDSLLDLTTSSTPSRVEESYNILIDHLQADRPDMKCLAASVVLLEYALERSIFERSK